MTERPTRPPRALLPPERAAYWDELAERIGRAAAARAHRGALGWLGERGARVGGVGVGAAAAMLVWALQMPTQPSPPPEARGSEWVRALTPSDSLGRTLARERAPGLGSFVLARGPSAARPTAGRDR